MTLVPHIIPRFPVSRRYISEVSAMDETDHLSTVIHQVRVAKSFSRFTAFSAAHTLSWRPPPPKTKEGRAVNDNDIFSCPANGFHK
jgi:hypothetical protein